MLALLKVVLYGSSVICILVFVFSILLVVLSFVVLVFFILVAFLISHKIWTVNPKIGQPPFLLAAAM